MGRAPRNLERASVSSRTASVALSRLAGLGHVELVRKGKAFHEAVYAKT